MSLTLKVEHGATGLLLLLMKMNLSRISWTTLGIAFLWQINKCSTFTTMVPSNYARRVAFSRNSLLFYKYTGENDETFDLDVLHRRITEFKMNMLEEDLQRPPNANLSPRQFVESIFQGLLHNEEPFPNSGFKLLLRASTEKMKSQIYQSIAAPPSADLELVANALGEAIGRPHQQFAILVGEEGDDNYYVSFPSEELDFLDGTCWVQCVLRNRHDGSVMVVTGWQLKEQEDGAWLVDQIDWQDFREDYRPGIGREEWMPFEG